MSRDAKIAATPSGHDLRRVVERLLASKNECSPELHKMGTLLVREHERLLIERETGPMPHKCSNPECGTIEYGVGYATCPGCGGTEGRADV